MIFHFSFEGSVDKGLHELLLEVFDIIKAIHSTSHSLGQFA